jgi:hypothetical protein
MIRKETTMGGFITKAEVEANRQFIVDTWGERVYNACMNAEGSTFLAVLVECGVL